MYLQRELSSAGLKDESSTDTSKPEEKEDVFEDAVSQQPSPEHKPETKEQGRCSFKIHTNIKK